MPGALSFEVGAIFMIEDRASPILARLSEQFTELNTVIDRVKAGLAELGKGENFTSLRTALTGINEAFTGVERAAATAGTAIGESMTAAAARVAAVTEQVQALLAALRAVPEAAAFSAPREASRPESPGSALVPAGIAAGMAAGSTEGEIYAAFIASQQRAAAAAAAGMGGGGSQPPGIGPAGMLPGPGGAQPRGAGFGGAGGGGAFGGGGGGRGGLVGPFGAPGVMPPGGGGGGTQAGAFGGLDIFDFLEGIVGWREFRLAMQGDLALRQALESINIRPEDPRFGPAMERLRATSFAATDQTIFNAPRGMEMLAHFIGVLAKPEEMGLEAAERLFPVAARVGELSEMRHKGRAESEAVAAAEFAHLTGRYEPAQMEPMLDTVNAIAKRTDTSIVRQQEIMRYGMPMALAAGISPEEAAGEMGFAELVMGPTTRAGTAYAQFLTRMLTVEPPRSAHHALTQSRIRQQFNRVLELDPEAKGAVANEAPRERQLAALRELHLVNAQGRLLAPAGHEEEYAKEQLRLLGTSGRDPQDVERILKDAFGQIGFRYAQIFTQTDSREREVQFQKLIRDSPTVRQEQADLLLAPMQQFQQALAQVDTILSGMANQTLVTFRDGLVGVNTVLGSIRDFNREHPGIEKDEGFGMLGGLLMGVGRGVGWLTSGMAPGIRRMLASGLGTVAGGAGRFFMGVAAGDLLHQGVEGLENWIGGPGTSERVSEWANKLLFWPFGQGSTTDKTTPRRIPDTSIYPPGEKPAQGPQTVTIHVGPITMSGVADEATFRNLLSRLTDSVKHALDTATSPGSGVTSSPFTWGGPP